MGSLQKWAILPYADIVKFGFCIYYGGGGIAEYSSYSLNFQTAFTQTTTLTLTSANKTPELRSSSCVVGSVGCIPQLHLLGAKNLFGGGEGENIPLFHCGASTGKIIIVKKHIRICHGELFQHFALVSIIL